MIESQLHKGIALAKAGKKAEARNVLGQVVKSAPQLAPGWLWLADVVETREQRQYCLEKVVRLNPQNEVARQALAQIEAMASGGNKGDFRKIVADIFDPSGDEFYYSGKNADKGLEGESLLLDVCQEIFSTSFSIFDLSSGDHNVYLDLGIALGLNRPIIAVAREKTPLPPVLREQSVITYADYSELEAQLSRLCDRGFPTKTQPTSDHCYFCGRACESMSTPPDDNAYLALNRSKLLWRSLMQSLAPHLANYHLYPVYLTDRESGPGLCDMRKKVLASRFALCHPGTLSDENSYLSLGMAIGSRTPWILLHKKDDGSIPLSLREVDRVEYATLGDLQGSLTDTLGTFLGRIRPSSATVSDKTSLLSLPFWVQLEDWINHVARPAGAQEIKGKIQIAQYKGQRLLAKRAIPAGGLLFGRSADCNVVVDNHGVSSHHFRVLSGRTGKYFVEDLHSKNGTFLNGARLSPGQRMEINIDDTIRIPGARFLVWDDRPLPKEKGIQYLDTTGLLPPIRQIEIPDIPPPAYLSTWNHPMVITVLLPDGHNRSMFEVQAYYPMGRILSEVVKLLDLPEGEHFFKVENKLVDNDETPLSIGLQRGDVLSIFMKG